MPSSTLLSMSECVLLIHKIYLENIEWKVHSGSQRISLIIIYRPPYSEARPVTTAMFHAEFAKYLESVVLSVDLFLIVGDFNIHVNCQDDIDTTKLLHLFESTGLEQHMFKSQLIIAAIRLTSL